MLHTPCAAPGTAGLAPHPAVYEKCTRGDPPNDEICNTEACSTPGLLRALSAQDLREFGLPKGIIFTILESWRVEKAVEFSPLRGEETLRGGGGAGHRDGRLRFLG